MGHGSSSQKLLRVKSENFDARIGETSDYVTLVRVSSTKNRLDRSQNRRSLRAPPPPSRPPPSSGRQRTQSRQRPVSSVPISQKPEKGSNIYSDIRSYLKNTDDINVEDGNETDSFDENMATYRPPVGNRRRRRPVSFANHCTSSCVCHECGNSRYKLLNWLLPNCTRNDAERLLAARCEGTFLIRKSEKFPGQYTLSFVCGEDIKHCLVLRSVYGFGLKEPYTFPTLQQFVMHYSACPLTEFNRHLNTTLKYPVFA